MQQQGFTRLTFIHRLLMATLFLLPLAVPAQKIALFKDGTFDSACSVIAVGTSPAVAGMSEYAFEVHTLEGLREIQDTWKVKNKKNNISVEETGIAVYVVKDKELLNAELLILPRQSAVHFKDAWYYFDMGLFDLAQRQFPLKYHSQMFAFDTHLQFAFFKDSIQNTPGFLFVLEPSEIKFEGHCDIESDSTVSYREGVAVLIEMNKEIKEQFPTEKYSTSLVTDVGFNPDGKSKVKIRIACSRSMYEALRLKITGKMEWTTNKLEARVYFKDQ